MVSLQKHGFLMFLCVLFNRLCFSVTFTICWWGALEGCFQDQERNVCQCTDRTTPLHLLTYPVAQARILSRCTWRIRSCDCLTITQVLRLAWCSPHSDQDVVTGWERLAKWTRSCDWAIAVCMENHMWLADCGQLGEPGVVAGWLQSLYFLWWAVGCLVYQRHLIVGCRTPMTDMTLVVWVLFVMGLNSLLCVAGWNLWMVYLIEGRF